MTMKTNKQYEREDDARTLLRAEEIRNDKKRLHNATEELKKQLGSFVYVWKDIKRDLNKKEQEQELKEQLIKEGFIEINNTQKELDNKKVECVLDVNAIGLLGSFNKKAKMQGKLFWSDSYKALMLMPKRCRTRGHIIKDKCYIKEI